MAAFSVKLYNFKIVGIKFGVHDGVLYHDNDQGGPSFESEPTLALMYPPFTVLKCTSSMFLVFMAL